MNNCEPLDDDTVLRRALVSAGQPSTSRPRRVLLLGCSLCANFGYCIHRDPSLPVYGLFVQPAAIAREMGRLEALLRDRGMRVRRKTTLSLCSMLTGSRRRIERAASGCDAIVCLSCDEGRRAVASTIVDAPVIAAMRNRGNMRVDLQRLRGRTYMKRDSLIVNGRLFAG